MRLLLSIIAVMLVVQSANAQSLWRNFFTTNQNPIVDVVAGSNATVQASTVGVNLRRFTVNSIPSGSGQTNWPLSSITNANHLTNWAFIPTNYVPAEARHATNADFASYATNAGFATNAGYSTNAGTADYVSTNLTNWIQGLVANVNQHYYFSSVTNALGVGTSTNCSTMIDIPVAASATNSVAIPTAGVYFLSRVSTNTVTRIEEGPIHLQTYIYVTGGGGVQSVTAHPEIWIWFTNNTMVQLGTSGPQVFTEGTGEPIIFNTTINIATATNLTGGAHILLRWYADAVANSPTWNFVIGGAYDSHISVNVPISSATINASQIVGVLTPSQIATNSPSANQVLTATSSGSAAWQNPTTLYPTNQGATVIALTGAETWLAFATNADFAISGLSGVSAYGTNVQKFTIIITNTAGPATKLMTVPASWIKHDGVNCYVTNQGILTGVVYPGMGTNAAFKCLK